MNPSQYLAEIRQAIQQNAWRVTTHARTELINDQLTATQVMATVITNGNIIEMYADTGRGPSCLVLC